MHPETQFLQLAQEDKKKSISFLFELTYPRLCLFVNKYLSDSVAAEDIVQEVFVKLLCADHSFSSLNAAKAFLYKAVRNDCLNTLKHLGVEQKFQQLQEGTSDQVTPSFVEAIISAEVSGELLNAIDQLPEECRKIFRLSFLEEMSNPDIAAALALSLQTVKNQKSRGYKLLRGILKDNVLSVLAFL
jgi:RNA polymerase sigma-70 factor (family 1)